MNREDDTTGLLFSVPAFYLGDRKVKSFISKSYRRYFKNIMTFLQIFQGYCDFFTSK